MTESNDAIKTFAEFETELEILLRQGESGGLNPILMGKVLLDHRDEIKKHGEIPSFWTEDSE